MATISEQIERIKGARDRMRAKLKSMGLADETHSIDELADDVEGIVYQGAVQAEVLEGATYTIPRGYHNGSGTVTGMTDVEGDEGRYKLQTKTITPTKKSQSAAPDSGYYGLSGVTVNAIPAEYQDVSSVTAGAGDVLATKTIVTKDGTVTAGTMPNNGTVTKTLDTSITSYTIAKGYHSGTGAVSIVTETKSVTPTKSTQTITPTSGKVLSSVTVSPIPADYIVTTISEASAAGSSDILTGKSAYVNGKLVEGSMLNNGAVDKTLDTTTTSYVVPEGYHSGVGTVKLVVETKTVTPTKSIQTVSPTSGKVLSKVTVNAIPANYITTTDADAVAANILLGKTAYVNSEKITGTMPNNGAISGTIDGLSKTSFTISAGYTSGGTVSLTSAIADALAEI